MGHLVDRCFDLRYARVCMKYFFVVLHQFAAGYSGSKAAAAAVRAILMTHHDKTNLHGVPPTCTNITTC